MAVMWEEASQQLGLLTRAQALKALTPKQLRYRVERGDLLRRRPNVFAVAGAPRTYEQHVLAAVLEAGDFAWASHRTAARLLGLRVPHPDGIDVLTLPNRRVRLPGVVHHRNRSIPLDAVRHVGPIPITSTALTLADCAPWLTGPRLRLAVEDARRRALVTAEEVEEVHAHLDRGRQTGRHLVVPLRPIVAERLHAGGSKRELDVLRVLQRAGVPLPVQQHPIGVGGRTRYLDFAYVSERIYVEFDGFAEHGLIRTTFDDDRERDAELALLGWLGLHVTSNTRPADLVDRIRRALELRAA